MPQRTATVHYQNADYPPGLLDEAIPSQPHR
jgi:hypothetical protein